MVQTVKNLPAMQETQIRYQGWEDPLGVGQWLPTPVKSQKPLSDEHVTLTFFLYFVLTC